MRRVAQQQADPEAARRFRGFAQYVAAIAGIEASSIEELETRAEEMLDDPVRGQAAGMVLDALIAAGAGKAFAPYTEIVIGVEA